jgi:hypothetical protein
MPGTSNLVQKSGFWSSHEIMNLIKQPEDMPDMKQREFTATANTIEERDNPVPGVRGRVRT